MRAIKKRRVRERVAKKCEEMLRETNGRVMGCNRVMGVMGKTEVGEIEENNSGWEEG